MEFINRLLLWQKFAVLGVIALVLAGIPSYMFFIEARKPHDVARHEARGIAPAAALLNLIRTTQEHRGISVNVLSGNSSATTSLKSRQEEVDKSVSAADAVLTREIRDEELQKSWREIRQGWRALAAADGSRSMDAAASFEAHTQLIGKQLKMLELVADHFELSLDPEAHTYFLMRASLFDIPHFAEALSQAGAIGAGHLAANASSLRIVAKPAVDPQISNQGLSVTNRIAMATLLDRVKFAQTAAVDGANKAMQADPQYRARLEKALQAVSAGATDATKLAEAEIVRSALLNYDSTAFLNAYTQAARELLDFNRTALETIDQDLKKRVDDFETRQRLTLGLVLLLAAVSTIVALVITRSVTQPVNHLMDVMRALAKGDTSARARISSTNEVGSLAKQFNRMVDEREAIANKIRAENDVLNESVLALLQGVAQLARRDLTVKLSVTEDVTGPVADALNLLTDETSKVLKQVTDISANVSTASLKVKEQSDRVVEVAEIGGHEIDRTSTELNGAAQAMNQIAELARTCNEAADQATRTTQTALHTVNATVSGINGTRDTIRETEKRIKRLGERSQEISGIVNLINTIAERTHILALNASMHAASAGEAGRGFAVVADEVQRLAENARQATAQIATLVNNIQVETADTVNAMNTAITQVVEGSKLAEQAGREMLQTQESTSQLVASVQQIAANSQGQARLSHQLLARSDEIRRVSQQTNAQLKAQAEHTTNLVEYAQRLLSAVNVFKLSA